MLNLKEIKEKFEYNVDCNSQQKYSERLNEIIENIKSIYVKKLEIENRGENYDFYIDNKRKEWYYEKDKNKKYEFKFYNFEYECYREGIYNNLYDILIILNNLDKFEDVGIEFLLNKYPVVLGRIENPYNYVDSYISARFNFDNNKKYFSYGGFKIVDDYKKEMNRHIKDTLRVFDDYKHIDYDSFESKYKDGYNILFKSDISEYSECLMLYNNIF